MRGPWFACVLAGCFSPAPQAGAPCATNRDCPSGLACSPDNRCERPGYVPPDVCGAALCEGDNLVGCGMTTTCAYGCGGTTPHCLQLAPSNGLVVALLDGVTADVTQIDLDFNTDDGTISSTDGGTTTVIRAAGTGVIAGIRFEMVDGNGVFAARSFSVTGTGANDTNATGDAPLVLFAATTIDVSGTLDVGGIGGTGGPGASNANGSTGASGCRGRAGRSNSGVGAAFGEGGGGGGGATAGGDGAASNQANPTGLGGSTCASAPTTIPLRGGNGGGHGGQDGANGGGGGGGAVMLVAMESITVSGTVTAPGAGGRSATTGAGGGGGGGGGGAILIEAPSVTIAGRLTANGGGGGAPAGGDDGSTGSLTSATPASGGTFSCVQTPGATPVTRRGGAGAAGTSSPNDGTTCTQQDAAMVVIASQGGGGGGAAGRIRVNRVVGGVTGLASPAALLTTATLE